MRSLYVVEQGARVVREGGKVCVMSEGARMESVRPEELSRCVVMGNVTLTAPAVRALLRAGSDVVFLTRGGKFVGRLSGGLAGNASLRLAQLRAFDDEAERLSMAKVLVGGKIENQRRLLRRHQKRKRSDGIAVALSRLRRALPDVGGARDLNALRGVEGAAAAAYFGCWKELITAPGVVFTRRIRRPPPDPVNVLLSFGYTLLGNLVHAAVQTAGLDPYIGCLHDVRRGRPSLVLDLMEELRSVLVDAAVLRAVNTRSVRAADFVKLDQGGDEIEEEWERKEYEQSKGSDGAPMRPILFTREGIKKWLAVWERRLSDRVFYRPRGLRLPLREIIQAQVYLLCRQLEGGEAYEPYVTPV